MAEIRAVPRPVEAPAVLDSPFVLRLLCGIVLFGTWEVAARLAAAPGHVATPSGIVAALPEVLKSAGFLKAAGATMLAVLQGLLIAVALGTFIGVAMGRLRVVDRVLRHYVSALFTMPIIAVVPLIILWLGNTGGARLATIVFAALFSVVLSARDGARAVPPEILDVARVYRARMHHVWIGITLPVALPFLLAGVRLAAGRALIGALVAEFLLSIDGIGFYIMVSSRTFQHDAAFVAVLVLAATGLAVDAAIHFLTRKLTPWYRRGA